MKQYWGNVQALLRKTMKNLAHYSGCYGQVQNRSNPGYKSEVFPLQKVCLAEGLHSDDQNSYQQWSNGEIKWNCCTMPVEVSTVKRQRARYLTNQPTKLPNNQPTNQTTNQPTNQPTNQLTYFRAIMTREDRQDLEPKKTLTAKISWIGKEVAEHQPNYSHYYQRRTVDCSEQLQTIAECARASVLRIINNNNNNNNVIKKEAEKIFKYKDLIIEIQIMWKVKAKVIPIIIRATGTISKSLR